MRDESKVFRNIEKQKELGSSKIAIDASTQPMSWLTPRRFTDDRCLGSRLASPTWVSALATAKDQRREAVGPRHVRRTRSPIVECRRRGSQLDPVKRMTDPITRYPPVKLSARINGGVFLFP